MLQYRCCCYRPAADWSHPQEMQTERGDGFRHSGKLTVIVYCMPTCRQSLAMTWCNEKCQNQQNTTDVIFQDFQRQLCGSP